MTVSKDVDGKEVYTTAGSSKRLASESHRPLTPPAPKKIEEDEDDTEKPAEVGTQCQRQGCNATFISDAESRTGDGESATCQYHPMPPLFREGSKVSICINPCVSCTCCRHEDRYMFNDASNDIFLGLSVLQAQGAGVR